MLYINMRIPSHPPAIIFINNDLSEQVQGVLIRQLLINQILTGEEFDSFVDEDSYYAENCKKAGLRIMVVRNLQEQENRNLADIVIFAKNGLGYILKNNYGPPGTALPLDKIYLSNLFFKKNE